MKKIDRISKEVMEIGTKNGLKPKGILLLDKTLKENIFAKGKKKSKAKIYQEVISPNVSREVADSKMGENTVRNAMIKKSILEVMESKTLNLTDDNLMICHKKIRDKAIKSKQYSTARSTNRDFMEIKGILKEKIENSNTVNILNLNIDNEEASVIKERLLGLGQKTGK